MQANNTSVLPRVDVVMIAYNNQAYIGEAIAGVMKQKGPFSLRLIVMDDCSTDSTPQVIEQWRERYPDKIAFFRNEHNLGLQRNYMEGFSHVDADYMAVCDADDYWFSARKIARQVAYMEAHPECAITFHRVVNYFEGSGEMSLSNGGQASDCDIEALSRSNFITNMSVMYRCGKVDLKNLPQWIARHRLADYAFHMLHACHGSIHFLSRPMGVYRRAAGCVWNADAFSKMKMSLEVRLDLIDHFAAQPRVVAGLTQASTAILVAMSRIASTDDERRYVQQQAARIGVDLDKAAAHAPTPRPARKPLASKVRALVSRLLPRPRP